MGGSATIPIVYGDMRGNVAKEDWNDAFSAFATSITTTTLKADTVQAKTSNIEVKSVSGGAVTVQGASGGNSYEGSVYVYSGSRTDGNKIGGTIELRAGEGFGTQKGGEVDIYGGNGGATGAGGVVDIAGGNASGGTANGGNVSLSGGTSAGGTAGKVVITGLVDWDGITGGVDLGNNTFKAKGYYKNVVTKTATYTATTSDDSIICNKGTAMTIDLPAATGSGKVFYIKNIGVGVVTVDPNSSETIDGETTQDLAKWEGIDIVDYASGAWVIV